MPAGPIQRTLLAGVMFAVTPFARAGGMPETFVYLADVAPHVRQDMRYASGRNFTGSKVPGYAAAECVLAEPAARALSQAGDALASRGLGLIVLDCYRPLRAVRRFVAWAKGGRGPDPLHHPRVDRAALIEEGYIARRSGHSTGYAVDLTLADAGGHELDMGTPFDFFDPLARTSNRRIPAEARERRKILVEAMRDAGFANYEREWWHFTLLKRPVDPPAYDFDILPRGN